MFIEEAHKTGKYFLKNPTECLGVYQNLLKTAYQYCTATQTTVFQSILKMDNSNTRIKRVQNINIKRLSTKT